MKLKDLGQLTKFTLANGNALIPLFSYAYLSNSKHDFQWGQATTVFFGSLSMAMSTQVFNQWSEMKQDSKMTRTCNRPLPTFKITRTGAFAIGSVLFLSSNLLFYNTRNHDAGNIANLIFASYLGLYTPLKMISPINTFVGAIVGSLPVVLGAVAAGGRQDSMCVQVWSQFLFMFAWQYSHFYGIYWKNQKDYLRAGFKMLNEPIKAANNLRALNIIGLGSWLAFAHQSEQPYVFSVLGCISTYLYGWKPIQPFQQAPNQNAQALKSASYRNFTAFFVCATVDMVMKYYQ